MDGRDENEREEDDDLEELEDEGGDAFGEEDDDGEGELADEHIHEEDAEEEEAPPPPPAGPDTSLRAFRGHRDSVYCVDLSPDGAWALSGSGDDTAALWRVADGAPCALLRASADTVSCVAFSTSGRLVAMGSFDTMVRVYRVDALAAGGEGVGGASSSSSSGGGGGGGAAAAAAAAPASPAPLHLLDGPSGGIEFIAWHPKGDVLLAGSADGTAWMWSAGEKAAAACMQVFVGHAGTVAAGLFSRDGKLVVTAGEDGSARIWSPKTGACLKVFDFGEAPLTSLATSPLDANLVCATAMDGTARLLNLDSKRVVYTVDHNTGAGAGGGRNGGGGGGGGPAAPSGEEDEEEPTTSAEWCAFLFACPTVASHALMLTPSHTTHTHTRAPAAPLFAPPTLGSPRAPPMGPFSSRTCLPPPSAIAFPLARASFAWPGYPAPRRCLQPPRRTVLCGYWMAGMAACAQSTRGTRVWCLTLKSPRLGWW